MSDSISAALVSSPAVKGNNNNNKGKAEDSKWGTQDTTKLLFIIMQHGNPEIAVQGWKDLGEKFQKAFGGKYSGDAAKKQFQRLRKGYLDEFPLSEKEDAGGNDSSVPAKGKGKGTIKAKAAPKSRKRAAAASVAPPFSSGANDADDEDAEERTLPPKKKAKTGTATTTTTITIPVATGSSLQDIEEEDEGVNGDVEEDAVTDAKNNKKKKPAAQQPKRKVPAAKKAKITEIDAKEEAGHYIDGDAHDEASNVEKPKHAKTTRAPAKPRAKKVMKKAGWGSKFDGPETDDEASREVD